MHTSTKSAWLVTFALVPAFSTTSTAQESPGAGYQPRFEPASCPFEATDEVLSAFECGYLVVPENRAVPDGRQLRLAVAVLSSTSEAPRPDPLVMIPGGPGGSMLRTIAAGVRSPLREDRRIIAFDPRGTGFSEPSICADLNAEWYRITWLGGLDREARRSEQLAALERCRAEVEREGVDLSRYSTLANARDLDDLRRVLGIEQWNLWGTSYGTRVALEALRSTPEGVRSVILDGPTPPNVPGPTEMARSFADAVSRLLGQCSADPSCDAVLPNAPARFWDVVEALERDPLVLRTAGRNGLPDPFVISGLTLAGGVMNVLYSASRRAVVPLVVRAAGARNEAFMLGAAAQMGRDPERVARWVKLTVDCQEREPFRSLPSPVPLHERGHGLLTQAGMGPDPAVCEAWHPFRAPPELGEPVESATPALIFSGEFDPITHRSHGAAAAVGLERARVFEVPGGAHGGAHGVACTREIIAEFLADPERPLDAGCLASLPAPAFITDPGELLRAMGGR